MYGDAHADGPSMELIALKNPNVHEQFSFSWGDLWWSCVAVVALVDVLVGGLGGRGFSGSVVGLNGLRAVFALVSTVGFSFPQEGSDTWPSQIAQGGSNVRVDIEAQVRRRK